MNKELSPNKVVAIEKMSDEELLEDFLYKSGLDIKDELNTQLTSEQIKTELLNRLSSKSVEEYKKKLVEEIEKEYHSRELDARQECLLRGNGFIKLFSKKEILDLINNLK